MTTIKSDKTPISAPAEKVFEKLSNLENLKPLLERVPREQIPEDKREIFDRLQVTADSIVIPGGPVGDITLRLTDTLPYSLVRLQGIGTPVPLAMQMEMESTGPDSCEAVVSASLDIPIMLKPMVSGPLKKIVDQFAAVLGSMKFND